MSDAGRLALIVAADDIRAAVDLLAGLEGESSGDDPAPDLVPDDVLRVMEVIANHIDPNTTGDVPLAEKIAAALGITAKHRRRGDANQAER